MISPNHYVTISILLFTLGMIGVMVRRNLIILLMSLELMMNAVNLNLVAFSSHLGDWGGQIFVIFVITVAAGEAAIGLGIIVAVYRKRKAMEADALNRMEG